MDAAQVEALMLAGMNDANLKFTAYGTWKYDHTPSSWDPIPHKVGDVYSNQYFFESWYEWTEADGLDYVVVPGLGKVYPQDFDTGGEGHGENIYMVFKVEFDNYWPEVKYYRVDGYYASFDGSTWDGDLYEVKPVDRMVTFYEKA